MLTQNNLFKFIVSNKNKNILFGKLGLLVPDGGIYVAFKDYKVDTGTSAGKVPLGHGMVIAVDNYGHTRGSEYGRYDKKSEGLARKVIVPNLKAVDPNNPTPKEMNNYAKALAKLYGHGVGKVIVSYIPDVDYKGMVSDMQSAECNNPKSFYQDKKYNIINHNCGTYANSLIQKNKNSGAISKFLQFGITNWGTPEKAIPFGGTKGYYPKYEKRTLKQIISERK